MRIYAHVGLPKTATTFLQESYFPKNFPKSNYFFPQKQDAELKPFFAFLYYINAVQDPNLPFDCAQSRVMSPQYLARMQEQARTELQRLKTKLFKKNCNRFYISSEGLVGVSWNPCLNNQKNIEIIKQVFSDLKILFVIRRQDVWASSLYRQLVFQEDRFGRCLPIDELFPNGVDQLDWMWIYENYTDKVGKENVKLIPFEKFQEDPLLFLSEIANFFDINEEKHPDNINKKLNYGTNRHYNWHQWEPTAAFYWVSRLFGIRVRRALQRRSRKLLTSIFPSKSYVRIYDPAKDFLSMTQHIQEQNRRLAKYSEVDLDRYGYY